MILTDGDVEVRVRANRLAQQCRVLCAKSRDFLRNFSFQESTKRQFIADHLTPRSTSPCFIIIIIISILPRFPTWLFPCLVKQGFLDVGLEQSLT